MPTQTETRHEQETQRPERPPAPEAHDGRALTDLVKQLRDDAALMMRQEVALAKRETGEKVARATRNAVSIAVGAFIAYTGLIFLLLAATAGLLIGMIAADVTFGVSLWLAPLIVGLVIGIVGYICIQKGISTLKRESAVPEHTIESIQESKEWLAEKTR